MVGKIISTRMTGTVVVEVTRLVRHPMYERVVRRSARFKADKAGLQPRLGDEVRIEETRPISKGKRWRLLEVVRQAPEAVEELSS